MTDAEKAYWYARGVSPASAPARPKQPPQGEARRMSEPKLCRDCRHVIAPPWWNIMAWGYFHLHARCRLFPAGGDTDPVSGSATLPRFAHCDMRRIEFGLCGPEGKLFEPKQGRGG